MGDLANNPKVRSCGDCTFCCKALGVAELKKPNDQWCEHCKPGVGCKIYADRPSSCVTFECMWLQGVFEEDDRPDKIRACFCQNSSNSLTAWVNDFDKVTQRTQFLIRVLTSMDNVAVIIAQKKLRKLVLPKSMKNELVTIDEKDEQF